MLRARHPIGQAAKRAGVSTKTIRNYEKAGLIDPLRDTSGRRLFTDDEILLIRRINEGNRERYPLLIGGL